ncbi:MAG: HU family DNA-binding protein [Bacteroidota bacterium]|nr:integration host factor subunit beta [Candidatus Kapabacteria bacterium]MCS7302423.1 integration host factor subunit beta [Candidatus Kapabacteria bacterium]MCX7937103.1 integration host factor subunit beta [Chlorobiota bacterium]MDW8074596.1 HU family DNA-binding protein [Bacteroidota bacterium]MDW8270928.1 HU family DNA-binding protein [Bacteroidota bacterium]
MPSNVTKAELVDYIASKTGLTKLEVKAVVEGFLDGIKQAMFQGRRIEIRGFGVFSVKARRARMARNPRTGEQVPLGERYIPAFRPSDEFISEVDSTIKERISSGGQSSESQDN